MPLAATQLALCVFSTERLDKGSDDHGVHTRVHLLRGLYLFIDWSSTQHTSVHIHVYIHTHFRREQRERASARKAFKLCAVLCADTAWYNRSI